jgi:hypothetical protein
MYLIKEIKSQLFEVANFVDDKYPHSVYQVKWTQTNDYFHCNCPGFRMQKIKDEHKHCIAVKEWIKLGKKPYFIEVDDEIKHYKGYA